MKLNPCPFCGVAVDSGPTGGIYIHHPIDSKNPWACNMTNADIRVADWQNRPGEAAARAEALEEAVKAIEDESDQSSHHTQYRSGYNNALKLAIAAVKGVGGGQ